MVIPQNSFNLISQSVKIPSVKISAIYKIVNKVNGKIYIGSATNINRRCYNHIWRLNKGDHHSRHLQRAWKKYGSEAFDFIIIEEVPRESLIEKEQFYLDRLKPYHIRIGYNLSKEAGSTLGVKMTNKTKAKISKAHRGKYAGDKNPNYGKTGVNAVWYNKKHTAETKQLMSSKTKTKKIPVYQFDMNGVLIKLHDSMSEAANYLWNVLMIKSNLNKGSVVTSIKNCCQNNNLSYHNFKWKFVNE